MDLLSVAVLLGLLLGSPSAGQSSDSIPLFHGSTLEGWTVPTETSRHFVMADGVLRVQGGSGWLLSKQAYNDFVLTFEARNAGGDSIGGVFIRALAAPRVGYEVRVANRRKPASVLWLHHAGKPTPLDEELPAVLPDDDQWHEYRVICVHDQATVLRDGRELAVVRGLELNTGLVGVHAEKGRLELRNMRIQKAAEPPVESGEPRLSGPGVSLPRPTRDVKPQYTEEALRLRIQGEVWVNCLVMVDGHVAQCQVVRRLSTGLDAQALLAARQWTFEPATRDGMPTPFPLTLAITFALRE